MAEHTELLEYIDDDRRIALYRRTDTKSDYWQGRYRIKRVAIDDVKRRRNKLLEKLEEQKEIAKADMAGAEYKATKKIWITNDDGVKEQVERERRLTRWYWRSNDSWFLQLRYGARVMDLGKGRNAIEVKNEKELLTTMDTCLEAVKAGELDKILEEMATIKSKRI